MSNKILVTGATGNIGKNVVKLLQDANADFVAASSTGPIDGVDTVVLDFADPASIEAAMQGISTVFMVLAGHPDMVTWGRNVIAAAQKTGVKHIVRSGGSLADISSDIGVRQGLALTDQDLKNSGIDYTITAPNFFAQNFINFFAEDYKNGALYLPAADGKVGWADVRDIAAVNAIILQNPGKYRGQALKITGPDVLSYGEAIAVMNKVLGKDTKYVPVGYDDARKAMADLQFPPFVIDLMIDLSRCIAKGYANEITTTIKDVTGKEPISFEQFVKDNTAAWL